MKMATKKARVGIVERRMIKMPEDGNPGNQKQILMLVTATSAS